jgi:hypothetical protein
MKKIMIILFAVFSYQSTFSQYNACAGKSEIREAVDVEKKDAVTGQMVKTVEYIKPSETDAYGNLKGNEYDLAKDGAFTGQTIFVLNICGNTMSYSKAAVLEKGFSMVETNAVPDIKTFVECLQKACQFWILSGGSSSQLTEEHLKAIEAYFKSGRGVYIWNDNTPYHVDGNIITSRLINVTMSGEYYGDQVLQFKSPDKQYGLVPNHLITTGLETVYEGITVSTIIDPDQNLTPIMYSSDGNVVTAVYERNGLRLIVDGGFTRLCVKWDAAGTARYVKNAAAWLANAERFGEEVTVIK